ncbi:dihydrofolate reductase, partial [Microgenomates group bacterium]|nr:dihydrofolate reductase [Microgenomates group bacterium]
KKDFAHFKKITTGHPVIMGRKTYQSIGKPLPGRTNIIITRNPHSVPERNVKITHSLKEAIDLAKSIDNQEIFIIGGGEIYRQSMADNLVDKLYITHVKGDFKADVFFPDYSHFKLLKQVNGREGQYRFTFYVFEKH